MPTPKPSDKNDFFKNFIPLHGNYIFGNKHNKKLLNTKEELKALEKNPLGPLLKKISKEEYEIFRNELVRQDEAYYLYYLAMERFLKTVSVSIQFNKRIRYKVKNGYRLTPSERELKKKYQESSRFTEFDFFNCLIAGAGFQRDLFSRLAGPPGTAISDLQRDLLVSDIG